MNVFFVLIQILNFQPFPICLVYSFNVRGKLIFFYLVLFLFGRIVTNLSILSFIFRNDGGLKGRCSTIVSASGSSGRFINFFIPF